MINATIKRTQNPFYNKGVLSTAPSVHVTVFKVIPRDFVYYGRDTTLEAQRPHRLTMPSPKELKAMPVANRKIYLEMSARAMKNAYENNPELTVFTALDDEDFVDEAV
ncbi:MAG: hypothetical protein V1794_04885 [Candidatus Glassbacteria bacterium]